VGESQLDRRRAYFDLLEERARSTHLFALLGASARIRQYVTGRLPSREDWAANLTAYVGEFCPSIRARAGEYYFENYFPTEIDGEFKEYRHVNHSFLVDFADYWLSEKPEEFQNDRARELLSKVWRGAGIKEEFKKTAMGPKAARTFVMKVVGSLKDREAPWAPGLRLFDWPAIRSGFQAYETIDGIDERGAFLMVRASRDWSTSSDIAPECLVRDLVWIRSRPNHDNDAAQGEADVFKGAGRYYSQFNSHAYVLERGIRAGPEWNRYSGPPIDGQDRHQRRLEILCPALHTIIGDQAAFALMIAHTKDEETPGVWKALITRVNDSLPGWSDWSNVEPDLELFGSPTAGSDLDTNVPALMSYLRARGMIGEPHAVQPASLLREFRDLLVRYQRPDHMARLRAVIADALKGDGDPLEAITAAWPTIEPSQILLPAGNRVFLESDDALWARNALFARSAIGQDTIAPLLQLIVTEHEARCVGVGTT